MHCAKLIYEVEDEVASIRLNYPAALNAMNPQMAADLFDALRQGERDARVIILSGEGRGFCSGADLGDSAFDLESPTRDAGRDLDGFYHPVMAQMRASTCPIVTAVRGAAAGIGCAIALAGDLIVASETAYFLQAFVRIGLAPDGGSSYLLARTIGRARAMEMMLLGEKVGAAQALEWGLINRVVPDSDLEGEAAALARRLAQGPGSIAVIKRLGWAAVDAGFETTLANERLGQRQAGLTADFPEGVAAFRERRPPRFQGR